jgi:hypothetical protein
MSLKSKVTSRVARLGEVSPNVSSVCFGQFLAHIFVLPLSYMGMYTLRINFGKNELGYLLGEFFTNSSGHPGHKWTIGKVPKKQKKIM